MSIAPYPFRADDVAICAAIQKKHATSYAMATRLFPPKERAAVQVLYAFVRTADDLVDEPLDPDPQAMHAALDAWISQWEDAYAAGTSEDPVLRASATLFHEFGIPLSYADAFLGAMRLDLTKHRYGSYAQLLHDYVYGSAAIIGLSLCRICGIQDPATLRQAQSLGEAMQLTNFLRDMREDYLDRGRIYLAEEDMVSCGVSEADIAEGNVTPGVIRLLTLYIARARALYEEADLGIQALPPFARKPVRLSRILYSRILDKIEANHYDVFRRRARTNDGMKALLFLKTLLFS